MTDNAVILGTDGITVNLRWLTIKYVGAGNGHGIYATRVSTLNIENCIVDGFTASGITVFPVGPSVTRRVFIKDTIIRNNPNVAMYLGDGGTDLSATIENTWIENNYKGIVVIGQSAKATVRGSVLRQRFRGFPGIEWSSIRYRE